MQARLKLVKAGNPLDPETMILKFLKHNAIKSLTISILVKKKAVVLAGGEAGNHEGDLAGGYYIQPTVLKGTNDMRVFQEEILDQL
jgi:aldehyde dehydrogenase (NAD+)/aldehyde dehydrogenase